MFEKSIVMQNFVLQTPSLQHLAGVKTVTQLWHQPDILTQIARSFNGVTRGDIIEDTRDWKAIEDQVRSKIWALSLPEMCKKEWATILKPIGMEVIAWCHFHNLGDSTFLFIDPLLPRQFCWTMHGTIEYKKTAEAMVNDGRLSVNLRGGSICQYLLTVVLGRGTRATCEYFLKKVSQSEKENVLKQIEIIAIHSKLSPTCGLRYCLSLLNAEQQDCLFKDITELLPLLLHWPLQSFFTEVANLERRSCSTALATIISKIRLGYQDYDYAQSFKELWRLTPVEYKQDFLDNIYRLEELFATKRKEFIQLVLNRAPLHRLQKLVEKRYDRISAVLLDVSFISDAVWMEWKATAALNGSNDRDNMEKRSRSDYISRLVDTVLESRIKSRVPM